MARQSVLQRAETLYLFILRAVILAVATIALIAVVYGLLSATPLLTSRHPQPGSAPASLEPASLGDFVAEKKSQGAPVGVASTGDDTSADATAADTVTSSVTVRDAAKNVTHYIRARLGEDTSLSALIKVMEADEATVPDDFHPAYEQSLLSLTKQLNVARGQPLTVDNLIDLLQWHAAKFKSAADADTEKQAEQRAAAFLKLQIAGYALIAFLLVTFAFIFVKIERNLRVVHTLARVEP